MVPFMPSKVKLEFVALVLMHVSCIFNMHKPHKLVSAAFRVLVCSWLFIFHELNQSVSQAEAMTRQGVRGAAC